MTNPTSVSVGLKKELGYASQNYHPSYLVSGKL